ncbi:MAG: formylmethanofuran--tetrahydromethanopterin N-formyltransferase [Alphaproteobacteria bacterium]|nr:formylmethanofuran--tetrahydromethanopterin N-formyltransferase [Alphaproteobacteria bacterium]
MIINGIKIENTFAEAFPMKVVRLIITADSKYWLKQAANNVTGFATSVIACGCEAGVEKEIKSSQTPDGRSGIAVLLFAMDSKGLAKQVLRRVGQCILTSPTTACFSGLESNEKINLGSAIRFFGDGFQVSKKINDKKIWRIPVMEGEFVIEDKTSITNGIGGGNILIIGNSNGEVLKSAEAAVKEMKKVNNIILPFPGGIVRSGSKVGSKYKSLIASTNDAYCPTLKGITKTKLSKSNESVLEIVIDGINEKDISLAMKKGINIICKKFNKGIKSISAGNYGGKLGPHHFHLRDVMK